VTEVFVVRDADVLWHAVAARLITRVVDRQAASGRARVLVADDPAAWGVLRALALSQARAAVDLGRLQLWWADAAWLPPGSPRRDRAADAPPVGGPDGPTDPHEQALSALEQVGLPRDPWRPFEVTHEDPEVDAARYAEDLAAARQPEEHGPVPTFDIALHGLRPSGGVAGVDPESPAVHDQRPVVVSTRGEQRRITLGPAALASADEVWLIGTGHEVAPAAHLALTGAGPLQVPAAAMRGLRRTLMFLDEPAATRLPPSLRRLASP
jgi:6-phosphogluconolactonase